MSPTQPLTRFARRLQRNQRGTAALTFLLTTGIMVMGTLGAMDLARYNIAQNRLQNAVDATGISAGQALTAWDPASSSDKVAWQNYAGAFFSANMPDSYLNSTVTANTIKAGIQYCTANPSGAITCPSQVTAGTPVSAQYVNIDARGTLPMLSVGFLKIASMPLVADNQVIRRLKNHTEIVLALEDSRNTGDLSGNSENAKIKAAAKDLVEAALGAMNLGGSTAAQGIRVGIVPFSAMVRMNPGGDATNTPNAKNWVKTVADKDLKVWNYVRNNWLGCIAEPYPPVKGYYWGSGGNRELPADKRAPPTPDDINDPNNFLPVFMPLPATSANYNNLGAFVDNTKTITVKEDGTGTLIQVTKGNQVNLIPTAPSAGRAAPNDEANYRFIGMDPVSKWAGLNPVVYSTFEPDSCVWVGRTQFLSQDVTILNAAIDTMQGSQFSESLIPGGLLWSWRMLAPEWSSSAVGATRGWDDSHPDLPADPANTDPAKAMVNGRALVLVSTGKNSTASADESLYRAPRMYNPTDPKSDSYDPSVPLALAQKSDFLMAVNYCNNGNTLPITNANKVATGCPLGGGALQTGAITIPFPPKTTPSIIDGDTPVGNRGGPHGGKDVIKTIGIWPTTSLVNLDMRPAAFGSLTSTFVGDGSKLNGSHAINTFQDLTASIGWPLEMPTALTTDSATAYMLAVCDAIKKDSPSHPIYLYTVFLGGGDKDAMGTCATGPAYAFTDTNANNLRSTFAAILGSMTELKLTQ